MTDSEASDQTPPTVTAQQPHRASYPDPLVVTAGDLLILSGRFDMWDGHRWIWATAPDGRAGWVPDTLVDGASRALWAYSAAELDVDRDTRLTLLSQTHGWSWCARSDGQKGWLPDRCLSAPKEI